MVNIYDFQVATDHKIVLIPAQLFLYLQFAEKVGWYERIENNGWRLVSDRLITNLLTDPVTWETSRKKVDFSHVTVSF